MAVSDNINTKSSREVSLEKQLNSLCTNENCKKIKDLLSDVLSLSCILEKCLNQYITENNKNNANTSDDKSNNTHNLETEILNSMNIQRSFLNVIYFESFNELANTECNFEQIVISKNEITHKILSYIDILSRLYILIDNNLHSKYIIEILFGINKILTLFIGL